ncbi:MAG: membrane protein insertion efficiency factor YidD [Phycisphaerales bacterium]
MAESRTRSRWAVLGWPAVLLIRLYRATLSPFIGGQCRFHPTCSRYGEDAFLTHNPLYALWLTCRRLLRCHPWGGSGVDPVPSFHPREADRCAKDAQVSVDLHTEISDESDP